ncbi:MAG: hypothetical protein K6A05_01710, partial [Lachnospiraceae bacterium]|nr:hypothetical protein [Lachnospiraceae bacterium]
DHGTAHVATANKTNFVISFHIDSSPFLFLILIIANVRKCKSARTYNYSYLFEGRLSNGAGRRIRAIIVRIEAFAEI